jgi:hypothetical protein
MKSKVRASFSFFFVFVLCASQTLAQEKIEWSASHRITLSDFKGHPPDASVKQSLKSRTGIESKMTGREIKEIKNFNARITAYFFPADSWIMTSDPSRLTYFLTLFDMDEWMARELRKRSRENRKLVYAGGYEMIYAEVNNEFAKIRDQYGQETNYGTDHEKQQEWEAKIHERLSDLSDYCKSCGSKK